MTWWWMGWTTGVHAKGHVREWANKRCMQRDVFANGWSCKDVFTDERMDKHANMCSWMDGQKNIHFSQMDKPVRHANIQARRNVQMQHQVNPTTIEYSTHLAMRRWSCDTPWRHPSPSSTAARHEHQQQNECTSTVMLSLFMIHVVHITTMGHIADQCNVMWKSKRPTCNLKSHVSQTIMREFK